MSLAKKTRKFAKQTPRNQCYLVFFPLHESWGVGWKNGSNVFSWLDAEDFDSSKARATYVWSLPLSTTNTRLKIYKLELKTFDIAE